MKRNIIYALTVGMLLSGTSCAPDDYSMPKAVVSPSELVEGIAYSVTPSESNPNKIVLKSLVKGVVPVWETPNGLSQDQQITLDLPFSGEYPIKFGVVNGSGVVWGDTYTIVVDNNDFGMLSDEIWTNLAGGVDENGNGQPKVWVPMDKAYPPYVGSAPVGYMSPDDVKNDGSASSDVVFGTGNWNMNWDPGFQSWLIPADDPYMGSSMVLSLDPVKGCVAEINRVEASGQTSVCGGFALNISDPKRPTINFNKCEMLHAAWGDGVSSNYTKDIKILECTPYVLQLGVMRDNSEGPWWIVWNFVAKDLKDGIISIPTGEPELIEKNPVQLPEYTDLATELFKISGTEATYVGSQTTYLLNDETPYDLMWWNPGSATWDWIINGGYNDSWAPAYADEDFAMTLEQTGKMSLESAVTGSQSAKFTVEGNKIVFDQDITLLTAGGNVLKGTEFTVMKCSADDNEVVLGVPVETNAAGEYNKYLCARLTIKPIGGGQTGPIAIPVDNSKLDIYVEAGKYFRVQFYNPWAGKTDEEWPVDPTKLKLKKDQKLVVKFTVSGIEWTGSPKAAFCCNIDGYQWEPDCFTNFQAQAFNTTGETTLELVNNSGSTFSFSTVSALTITIQLDGFAASTDITDATVNVSSITIE